MVNESFCNHLILGAVFEEVFETMQCMEAIQARLFLSGYNIEEQKHLVCFLFTSSLVSHRPPPLPEHHTYFPKPVNYC